MRLIALKCMILTKLCYVILAVLFRIAIPPVKTQPSLLTNLSGARNDYAWVIRYRLVPSLAEILYYVHVLRIALYIYRRNMSSYGHIIYLRTVSCVFGRVGSSSSVTVYI